MESKGSAEEKERTHNERLVSLAEVLQLNQFAIPTLVHLKQYLISRAPTPSVCTRTDTHEYRHRNYL